MMVRYKSPQFPLFQRGGQVVAFFQAAGTVAPPYAVYSICGRGGTAYEWYPMGGHGGPP